MNFRLNGNQLKMIALVSMTIDHIGYVLFPQQSIFRILGRIAFPIFGFFIAEGCVYTKNRKKYLWTILGFGLLMQLVYYLAMKSLFCNIFITFSLSIAWIYAIDSYRKEKSFVGLGIMSVISIVLFLVLPSVLRHTDYTIDFGIAGVLYPVLIYLFHENKEKQMMAILLGLCALSIQMGMNQWYGFLAVPFLYFYDGTRGKKPLKWLFYVYYPLHLVILQGISYLMH